MNDLRKLLFLWCLLFCSFQISAQCLLEKSTLEQRTLEAEMIIEGKIIDQYSFWGENDKMIYTANKIDLYKSFKGEAEGTTIEVITVGGVVGDNMITASPSLELTVGDKGLFLLKTYKGNYIDNSRAKIWIGIAENASMVKFNPVDDTIKDIFGETFGNKEALYRTIEDYTNLSREIIKEEPVSNNERNVVPAITNITPLTATAGTETLITITGTDFGAAQGTVFFDAADDGSGGSYTGSSSYHIQSWSNTSIEVWVPSGSGTGRIFVRDNGGVSGSLSSQTLTVSYNIANVNSGGSVFRTYLIDDLCDGDGGYKIHYMTNTANGGVDFTAEDGGNAQASFERSIVSWQANGFAAYAGDGCGTTSTQSPGDDGEIMVGFDNNVWDLDTEASNSTLGVCYSQFNKCSGASATEWEVTGFDIIFRRDGNPNGTGGSVTWEYGGSDGSVTPSAGESDFESVALHEVGHAHQLGHIINSGAVMHYSISTGTFNRTLGTPEVDGANDVEALSAGYVPILIGCAGDFNCSRQYMVYDADEDCLTSLPIELLSFKGSLKGDEIVLHWQTATEINNDYFLVEKSTDGRTFEKIGTVRGSGTSYAPQEYDLLDPQPTIGTNYYRLTQFDYDGSFKVIDQIVAVDYNKEGQIAVQPNPVAEEQIELIYQTGVAGSLKVDVYNITGQLVRQLFFEANASRNVYDIDLGDISGGVYILQTTQGDRIESLRFVKSKN